MIHLSTVTPVYRGQEFLPELVARLDQVRTRLTEETDALQIAEAIFVLDNPEDASEQVINQLARQFPWVRVVTLSRNFGQHNATVAGILHSSGDWVVTLDEDLQHPPEAMLDMLALAVEGKSDVVIAVPEEGSHGRAYRDATSQLSKRLIGALSRNQFVSSFGSFRLIRGQVARAAASVCSHQTYFDVALVWFTTRIATMPMKLKDERFRKHGTSGYSLHGLLSHAKRLVISSDIKFLNISFLITGLAFIVAVLLESWVLINYLVNPEVSDTRGWASLISVNLFFGGVLSLLLGFVLEISKINMFQGQGKPTFFTVDRGGDEQLGKVLQAVLSSGQQPDDANEQD
ncbi:MAG: glycosyltransferase family 2 protein [Xanthomonadales bacterium]|nr:glycosyltransferase family 2 protein [Xanthomonadales bacterium]NNL94226.1 glycosyltransferase family 2 protein [Xanthomonadales bacterium]